MTYVFDLDTNLGAIFIDNLGVEIVEFVLGYDIDEDVTVLMSVTLVPTQRGACDLRFGIRERDVTKDWKVSGLDYGQEKVRARIPDLHKADVSTLLLKAIDKLLLTTKYKKITMETYYSHLPVKAMAKYERIVKVLTKNGFSIRKTFRHEGGVNYWFFTKSDGGP